MNNRFEGTHLSCGMPQYAMPPLTYESNKVLSITFETSPDVVRDLVPDPLIVTGNSISIYVGEYNIVLPERISYHEAGMQIPVCYGDRAGTYMPILYVDKALPITMGREVWGFPKHEAGIGLDVGKEIVKAKVAKDGTTLVEATLNIGEAAAPMTLAPATVFLLKAIPSVEGFSRYDVQQLTTAVIRDGRKTEVRPGEGMLRLGSTASDPLEIIPVIRILTAVYAVGGFVLDYGDVVHDYLSQEKSTAAKTRKAKA